MGAFGGLFGDTPFGGSAGATYTIEVKVSVGATSGVRRGLTRRVAATVSTEPGILRSIGKSVASTVGAAPSIIRQIGRRIQVSVGADVSQQIHQAIIHSVSSVVAVTARVMRVIRKRPSVTVSADAGISRDMHRNVTAIVEADGSILRRIARTIQASVGGISDTTVGNVQGPAGFVLSRVAVVATVSRRVFRNVTATVEAQPRTIRRFPKAITATVSALSNMALHAVLELGTVPATAITWRLIKPTYIVRVRLGFGRRVARKFRLMRVEKPIYKDPDSKIPIGFDFAEFPTISAITWILGSPLVNEGFYTGTGAQRAVFVSGGVDGQDYTITARVMFDDGTLDDFTRLVKVRSL